MALIFYYKFELRKESLQFVKRLLSIEGSNLSTNHLNEFIHNHLDEALFVSRCFVCRLVYLLKLYQLQLYMFTNARTGIHKHYFMHTLCMPYILRDKMY